MIGIDQITSFLSFMESKKLVLLQPQDFYSILYKNILIAINARY